MSQEKHYYDSFNHNRMEYNSNAHLKEFESRNSSSANSGVNEFQKANYSECERLATSDWRFIRRPQNTSSPPRSPQSTNNTNAWSGTNEHETPHHNIPSHNVALDITRNWHEPQSNLTDFDRWTIPHSLNDYQPTKRTSSISSSDRKISSSSYLSSQKRPCTEQSFQCRRIKTPPPETPRLSDRNEARSRTHSNSTNSTSNSRGISNGETGGKEKSATDKERDAVIPRSSRGRLVEEPLMKNSRKVSFTHSEIQNHVGDGDYSTRDNTKLEGLLVSKPKADIADALKNINSFKKDNDRLSAYTVIEKYRLIPPQSLTAKQCKSLKWATQVIAAERKSSKRSRNRKAKLVKLVDGKQFNKVLAVMDTKGSISPSKWSIVEMRLLTIYKDILQKNPGPPPDCRDVGWHENRIKLIACSNERSAALYKQAVDLLGEVWSGANLKAIPHDEIPDIPLFKACIPAKPSDPNVVLELIQLSNPDIPTTNWRVSNVDEEKGTSRCVTIVLNEESLIPLNKTNGVINYGFSSIRLIKYKLDKIGSTTNDDHIVSK